MDETIKRVGAGAEPDSSKAVLAPNEAAIESCFSAATAEEIFEKLGGLGTEWGDSTLATLRKMSPTSVKVTMEAVLRHAKVRHATSCHVMPCHVTDPPCHATDTPRHATRHATTMPRILTRSPRQPGVTIGEALTSEYRLSQRCMVPDADFCEGIRAVLVDKDNNPQWSPAQLSGVTAEAVDGFFAPLGLEHGRGELSL